MLSRLSGPLFLYIMRLLYVECFFRAGFFTSSRPLYFTSQSQWQISITQSHTSANQARSSSGGFQVPGPALVWKTSLEECPRLLVLYVHIYHPSSIEYLLNYLPTLGRNEKLSHPVSSFSIQREFRKLSAEQPKPIRSPSEIQRLSKSGNVWTVIICFLICFCWIWIPAPTPSDGSRLL
jgi:hypothetical protein